MGKLLDVYCQDLLLRMKRKSKQMPGPSSTLLEKGKLLAFFFPTFFFFPFDLVFWIGQEGKLLLHFLGKTWQWFSVEQMSDSFLHLDTGFQPSW